MKIQNILAIFIVMAICLVAVSQVSAVDVTSNDVNNFTWLNDTIQNNDHVDLDNDVVLADAEAENFTYGIYINKSITINGNNHIINANDVGNIFIIEEGNTIILNNVKFINSGNSAIVNYGNLTVNDCLFENNTAVGYMMGGAGYGGAISNLGELNVDNTTFITNNAGFGGAIKNDGVSLIKNSTFFSNTAGAAGAIYNNRDLIILDSIFSYNEVTGFATFPVPANGGAIYSNVGSLVLIRNTTFYANNAVEGGAIFIDNASESRIEGCSFSFNNATSGGAIMKYYNETLITNNEFNNNTQNDICNYYGILSLSNNIASSGIVNVNGTIVSSTKIVIKNRDTIKVGETIEIEASLYDDNFNLIYDERGLELYANGELISGNFSSNVTGYYEITGVYPYSTKEEQICYSGYVNVVLYEGTFDELQDLINNAEENAILNLTKDFVSNGNAIYINKNITINGNGFTLDARRLSGIFYVANDISVNIYELNLINSTKSAIVNYGSLSLYSSEFKYDNDHTSLTGGAGYGGAIKNYGNLKIAICSFIQNMAIFGGAIYNEGNIVISSTGSFENNTAAEGGAIYNKGNLSIMNANFENNCANGFHGSYIANGYGGAIYHQNGDLNIVNTYFIANNVKNYGGAIYTYTDDTTSIPTVTIRDSYIIDNVAGVNGPALFTDADNTNISAIVNIINSCFDNNTISSIGSFNVGSIYLNNVVNSTIIKSEFSLSSSIVNKGVIYLEDNNIAGGINNLGFITSPTYIVIQNNETIGINDQITLKANIFDDNGNFIYDERDIYFNVNGTIIIGTFESPAIFSSNKTGYYEVSAKYNYANTTLQDVEKGFIIVADDYAIDIKDLSKYYSGKERLEAVLTKNGEAVVGETVALSINGKTYYIVTDSEGKVSLGINLLPGNYSVEASYGDLTEYGEVEVKNTVDAEDIVKMFHNGTQYIAYFCDAYGNALANTNVTFNINGVFYTRTTDANGKASLNINLNAGEYIITTYNSVTGECFSNKIVILPTLVANDVIKMKGAKAQYVVTAYDDQGNRLANTNITININGVQYTKTTDSNGVARLNINLNVGQYIVTASYNGFYTSNIITVVEI